MKAILELNEFQKIVDINRPLPMLRYLLVDKFKVSLYPEDEGNQNFIDDIDDRVINFYYKGQLGEFLFYKYEG